MKSAISMPIPPNHVAHWRVTDDGKVEIEILRFLYPGEAKLRRAKERFFGEVAE